MPGVFVYCISQNVHTLLAALDAEIFPDPGGVLLENVVILAERMPLPLIGKQNALEIGMAAEGDAEEIEDFALEPVGGRPDGNECGGLLVSAERDFQAKAGVVGEGIKLCNEVETLYAARPINGGVILKQIEFFIVAGVAGDFGELRGVKDEDGLLAVFERIENRGAEAFAIAAGEFAVERDLRRGRSGGF